MKKLATGYFNSVFDLGNGYVWKRKNFFWERYLKIFGEEYPKHGMQALTKTLDVMREMPEEHLSWLEQQIRDGTYRGSLELLSYPEFKRNGYTQRKVVVIKDYLESHGYQENVKVIDAYIDSIHTCWANGISEKVFKFTVNNGISESGSVVLFDLNEVSDDKEDARNRIRIKRWLTSLSYTHLSPELQVYYEQQMDLRMSEELLDRVWGTALAK